MKKILQLSLILFGLGLFAFSQQTMAQTAGGIGIRGGLNYNSNGQYFKDAELAWGSPLNNVGYNVGLFGKVNLGPFYLRPELNYVNNKSEINGDVFRTQTIDIPALVGLHLIGRVLSVYAGPSMHYYLEDQLRDFDFDKWNAGYQFGLGVNLGNVGIDLRYQRVLNGQTIVIDDVFTGNGDFNFQQLMLGLSIKF